MKGLMLILLLLSLQSFSCKQKINNSGADYDKFDNFFFSLIELNRDLEKDIRRLNQISESDNSFDKSQINSFSAKMVEDISNNSNHLEDIVDIFHSMLYCQGPPRFPS